MALTITATWLATRYGYQLDSSGGTGTVKWLRTSTWPERYSNKALGSGTSLTDLMVPLDGATVMYTATDDTGSATVTVVPPAVGNPVIGVLDDPSVVAVPVLVEAAREQTVNGRGVFYDVIGRNEPYVEPMQPIERTGSMTLRVAHPGGAYPGVDMSGLRNILRTGGRLMLRSPCNSNGRLEDVAFVVLTWRESQIGEGYGPDRRIDIEWRAIDPLWGIPVMSSRVWATTATEFATWTALVAGVPTWKVLAV